MVIAICLDFFYPFNPDGNIYFLAIKAYVITFPLGILDLYHSNTTVSMTQVILDAMFWCLSVVIRNIFIRSLLGEQVSTTVMVGADENSSYLIIPIELLRYVCYLIGTGLFTDMIFSPMHRLMHHAVIYKGMHKKHHESIQTI